jgi:hypothetical protein
MHKKSPTLLSRWQRYLPAAAAGALAGAAPAWAHHAFSAEFDVNEPVAFEGAVTKVEWTNPHSWLHVDVKDEAGNVTSWAIEFGSPTALMRKGLRRTDFPPGVEVLVKGYRAKSGKPIANASSVTLADGRDFYTAPDDSPSAAYGGGGD